jgi:hypothetical protein
MQDGHRSGFADLFYALQLSERNAILDFHRARRELGYRERLRTERSTALGFIPNLKVGVSAPEIR